MEKGKLKEASRVIEEAYENRKLLDKRDVQEIVRQCIDALNEGELRVALQKAPGDWEVQAWVKKAILLYFAISPMQNFSSGDLCYYDRIPVRKRHKESGVRVVPPAVCRYGAHVEKGAILMPSYVNIGAYVGKGSMVDTWATVGSCAQIGSSVHLSGGVGIGGVLEPPQGRPVIIEDHAFLGSRAIVVEGVLVGEGAVLGANVVLTASTHIIDVSQKEERVHKGEVPPHSVVIPGVRPKQFPAGEYMLPAALIIGKRKESTDKKTSLEQALRDFDLNV